MFELDKERLNDTEYINRLKGIFQPFNLPIINAKEPITSSKEALFIKSYIKDATLLVDLVVIDSNNHGKFVTLIIGDSANIKMYYY